MMWTGAEIVGEKIYGDMTLLVVCFGHSAGSEPLGSAGRSVRRGVARALPTPESWGSRPERAGPGGNRGR